jgi:predicted nucleic acid-binding protein
MIQNDQNNQNTKNQFTEILFSSNPKYFELVIPLIITKERIPAIYELRKASGMNLYASAQIVDEITELIELQCSSQKIVEWYQNIKMQLPEYFL